MNFGSNQRHRDGQWLKSAARMFRPFEPLPDVFQVFAELIHRTFLVIYQFLEIVQESAGRKLVGR